MVGYKKGGILMKEMSKDALQKACAEVKRRTNRHLIAGLSSSVLAILAVSIWEEPFPIWLMCLTVILLALSLKSLFQMWLDYRCPCCGAFLGSKRRLFHHDGWRPFFPKSCWQCHTDFETGEILPHEQQRWRNMPIEPPTKPTERK